MSCEGFNDSALLRRNHSPYYGYDEDADADADADEVRVP